MAFQPKEFFKKIFNRKATPAVTEPEKGPEWSNWSGRLHCEPAQIIEPKTVEELAEAVKNAKGPIRPIGSGHSFSALIPTEGTLVSLKHFTGILDHAPKTLQATIGAGTILHDIGGPLQDIGQALKNMGDIDKQTLAGAISTATHGTGADLGSLSSMITGLELVTASGDILWCDKETNADVFEAAKVSMGALGIITKVRMQNTTPYMLERNGWVEPLEEALERLEQRSKDNRHIEMFIIPYSDMAAVITTNIAPSGTPVSRNAEQTDPLDDLRKAHRWLGWSRALHKTVLNHELQKLKPEHEVDQSYKIFPNVRETKFNEMEYHLPREAGPAALREIRDAIYEQRLDIAFPIEFRLTDADDAWLSPFHGRKSCSIAVHQFADQDPTPYFDVIEPILIRHGGRPHWGKQHTMEAADLKKIYPHWDDFLKVRERLDPEGKFLNEHLAKVLGVKAKQSSLQAVPASKTLKSNKNNPPRPD